jgi:lipopolysaccharide export system protein LptA
MRLDSLVAKSIRVDLVKGADKRMSAKTAVAEGGVTIEARRSNVSKDQPPVIQNLHAVAQTATMQTDADKIILSGDVVVKVIEPGLSEPVNTIVGNRVIFSMKENKMRVEGESDKPAEITMTQKEKPKSETGQK